MDENYWEEENPKYIELECRIEQKESKINSGIITNDRTLRYAKRDIKRWQKQLSEMERYLDQLFIVANVIRIRIVAELEQKLINNHKNKNNEKNFNVLPNNGWNYCGLQ